MWWAVREGDGQVQALCDLLWLCWGTATGRSQSSDSSAGSHGWSCAGSGFFPNISVRGSVLGRIRVTDHGWSWDIHRDRHECVGGRSYKHNPLPTGVGSLCLSLCHETGITLLQFPKQLPRLPSTAEAEEAPLESSAYCKSKWHDIKSYFYQCFYEFDILTEMCWLRLVTFGILSYVKMNG